MRKLTKFFLIVLLFCAICVIVFVWFSVEQKQIVSYQLPLQQKWVFETDAEIGTTPVIYNDQVLVRTRYKLYAVNASTGHLTWSYSWPRDQHEDPPIVQDDIVIITHSEGTTALRLTTGELLWEMLDKSTRVDALPVAANENVVIIVDNFILIRDIKTGVLLWKIKNPYARSNAIVVLSNKNLYVVFEDQIRNYDVNTGKLLWNKKTEEWSLRNGLLNDDIFYLERNEEGISAYSLKEQRVLWSRNDLALSGYPITKYKNVLFIGTSGNAPVAIKAQTGETLWEAEGVWNYDNYQTALIFDKIVYIRGLFQNKIYALNMDNGTVIGYIRLGAVDIISTNAAYSLGPVKYDTLMIFPVDNKLLAYGK